MTTKTTPTITGAKAFAIKRSEFLYRDAAVLARLDALALLDVPEYLEKVSVAHAVLVDLVAFVVNREHLAHAVLVAQEARAVLKVHPVLMARPGCVDLQVLQVLVVLQDPLGLLTLGATTIPDTINITMTATKCCDWNNNKN